MDAVKNTITAIADVMETVRLQMIIFRYQLLHIKLGKNQLNNTLQAIRPDIKRYEDVVKQLKVKMRERRTLLEEKKSVPTIQVFRHRELTQKISALTEDIEELKSEKNLLLKQFDCDDDHGITEVKRRVASMESSLDKLNQQEGKYTAELNNALTQYAELQQQTADMDATELNSARQPIRPDKEREVIQQLQDTYGKRFDSGTLAQSRKDIDKMLDETVEPASIHKKLQQAIEQQNNHSHINTREQER